MLKTWLTITSLMGMLCAQHMHAQAARDIPITFNAFASISYSYNFNNPYAGKNYFRIFDFDDRAFKIDVIEAVLQRKAEQPNEFGFRVDLEAGHTVPQLTQSYGLLKGDSGIQNVLGYNVLFDVQQLYLTYVAPLGSGLRIDVGKFTAPHGYEVIDGYDGFNDNATRSFMFGYAVPGTLTGVRIGYTINPTVSIAVMAVQGWDVFKDNNDAKSGCIQILLTPTEKLLLSLCYIEGAERENNNDDLRALADLVSTYKASDELTLGLNLSMGSEWQAVDTSANAYWQGAALYGRYNINPKFAVAVRGEVFDDHYGARTGVPQTLKSVTLTPMYSPIPAVTVRADVRFDLSDEQVFDTKGVPYYSQPTLLVNAVYVY